MATTTNYGWTTPDNTALVKDGAAAIRSLGSSIDTTLKAQIDAQIPDTLLTNTGDIIYASAANTPARLAIGSTNQVLKVTGGVPVWGSGGAGNLTETVFNSSNASWTIPTGVTGIWALIIGGGGGGGATSTATAANSGGAGGAGQVREAFFAIAGGDTTLNITVGGGGAGGTAGGKGSTGSTSSIVGNTSGTTYASATGGGGGGGGAAANVTGLAGASAGGQGLTSSSQSGGGGGGFGGSANSRAYGFWDGNGWSTGQHTAPTTVGVTGGYSGLAGSGAAKYGGIGVNIWGRNVGGGGSGGAGPDTAISANFGGTSSVAVNIAAPAGTANTGGGGGATATNASTALAGGAGGSGLVVLRYVS
jgi:hypothetical protein